MSAPSRVIDDIEPGEARFDFETVFHVHYERIAGVIARVVGDPARAEELAVEVSRKLWAESRRAGSEGPGGWLYRGAIRIALDEFAQTKPTAAL